MYIPEEERSSLISDGYGTRFKLKVSDILVNSKKEHDNVTVKKAEIYFKDKKSRNNSCYDNSHKQKQGLYDNR
jgi:hypothetical protein